MTHLVGHRLRGCSGARKRRPGLTLGVSILCAHLPAASGSAREIPFQVAIAPGCYFLQLRQGAQTAVQQVIIGE